MSALYSVHPREGGDPFLSSLMQALEGNRPLFPPTTSPKALGPRLRGDERKI